MTWDTTLRRPGTVAPDLLAAVDIGSNSFRLEIARFDAGRYERIETLREAVRLGCGLDAQGQLSEEAMLRGIACLGSFARQLEGFAPHQVRAVATQTVREARNREEFLRLGAAALGHPIEVISGREEARLIYAGVAGLSPAPGLRRLVIDIGGRSTELILGEGATPLVAESFPIGSGSLSMRFFPEGRYTESAFRAARVAAGAALEGAAEAFAPGQWTEALGSSGTASAVSQLLAAHRISDGTITLEGLHWCIEQCLEAGSADALSLAGLKENRRMMLGGGLSILMALFTQFDLDALRATKGALRQGVIFELEERRAASCSPAAGPDLRDETVRRLQQRFGVDTAQAQRVRELALQLHASLEPEPDAGARHELDWGARLHELGMAVSHHDHHRHGAYLLSHLDADGFSQPQQQRLGLLVLGQRGRLRKVEEALARPEFVAQLLALRLAVLLCHARSAPPASTLEVRRSGRTVAVSLQPEWIESHPHTLFLLQEEKACWERTGLLKLVIKSARRQAEEPWDGAGPAAATRSQPRACATDEPLVAAH
ncbi:Ppx/GppA phosphatase family protein [Caldimonas tepidiphila]|uniref:Ppx/GppA phosphatase family protein n=1 Tax=Caldimonas tepidiphila TaxID=2315841 RepID=UPI000E5C08AD|nr:Ppx/GppA phosphatase family protein [Caldimonas tepidiphila]